MRTLAPPAVAAAPAIRAVAIFAAAAGAAANPAILVPDRAAEVPVMTMELAARNALARSLHMARRGRSWIHALAGRDVQILPWRHYPQRDAIDLSGRWQFYFHAHPVVAPDHEHHPQELGHVHLFRRSPGGQLAHLCVLVLDARGQPLQWQATNHWVTGGRWFAAPTLERWLAASPPRLHGPLAGVALWLGDLLRLYREPLRQMLHARDAALLHYCAVQGVAPRRALQDRRVSVWQSIPIRWPDDALAAVSG